jgi:hypothetical protein
MARIAEMPMPISKNIREEIRSLLLREGGLKAKWRSLEAEGNIWKFHTEAYRFHQQASLSPHMAMTLTLMMNDP